MFVEPDLLCNLIESSIVEPFEPEVLHNNAGVLHNNAGTSVFVELALIMLTYCVIMLVLVEPACYIT